MATYDDAVSEARDRANATGKPAYVYERSSTLNGNPDYGVLDYPPKNRQGRDVLYPAVAA